MAMHQGLIARNFTVAPPGYFTMVDSAFPFANPPRTDITLIYIGGDTPHIWTSADISSAFQRTSMIWPCWVRSNPSAVSAAGDANACASRLHAMGIPAGVNVILDLEIAVDASYVNTFNNIVTAAGYPVCKYGSQGSIWNNPKTSGGTFVAAPGIASPITIGDCVATQFDFAGAYDLTWVDNSVQLWGENMALTQADADLVAKAVAAITVAEPGQSHTGALGPAVGRLDAAMPGVVNSLSVIASAVAHQMDPAAVATAVVSQLAAQGFTASQIAQHILSGLPVDLANQVVAEMAAKLAA